MPDSPESFGDNPFARLDSGRFPKKRRGSPDIPELTPEEITDRHLFLHAVEHLPPPQKAAPHGFTIAEQCKLTAKAPVKKKKTGRQIPPPPPPAPVALSKEENPFIAAMASVKPLSGQGRRIAQRPVPRAPVIPPEATLEDFMAGKLEFAVSSTGEYLEGHVAGLDELILNRLREGALSPEAHMDLHGQNLEQAFENLREFMRQAWLKDLRVVLIVTGRGKNSPLGLSILRQKLQTWLTKEPFKRIVLAFCTAKPHDGGPGSIYVLLRRARKKGPVQWDRIFMDEYD